MAVQSGMSLKEISESIRERLNSPLFGTFLIVSMAFHWADLTYLAFSDADIESRIKTIQASFTWCAHVFMPMLTSLGYLALYPWLQALLNAYREYAELKSARLSVKMRKEKLEAKVKESNLLEVFSQQESNVELNEKLLKLKGENEVLQGEVDKAHALRANHKKKLSGEDEHRKIYELVNDEMKEIAFEYKNINAASEIVLETYANREDIRIEKRDEFRDYIGTFRKLIELEKADTVSLLDVCLDIRNAIQRMPTINHDSIEVNIAFRKFGEGINKIISIADLSRDKQAKIE
jgi:predicted transposase YbfD/YdcC